MTQRKMFSLILVAGLFLVCCSAPDGSESTETVGEKLTVTENQLTNSDNVFGLELFKRIAEEDPSTNVFISPLSISEALAMAYNGAGGETKAQMRSALGFGGLSDDQINQSFANLQAFLTGLDTSVVMQIANSIWYDNKFGFKQDFISTNQKYFGAEVAALDLQSGEPASRINDWVAQNTNGKITKIVEPPLDPRLAMMLINAIYFKGTWTHQFSDSLTRDDHFTSASGSKQQVKMMNQKVTVPYHDGGGLQAVDLPYGEGRFGMLILLPENGSDVNEIVAGLTDSSLAALISQMHSREGRIMLPRFRIEYEKTLNAVLQELGITDAFVPNTADFSGMSDAGNLYISDVKHKSFVEVNEEGTEAAAVTSIGIRVTAVGPEPFEFRVDRPFVFAIRELASNTILFIGRITDLSS